jgi:CDP-glucose 4,6-dehydratase
MQGEETYCEAFNFGPSINSNRTVKDLVNDVLEQWPGEYIDQHISESLHESKLLHLQIDKAHHILDWHPKWNYQTTIDRTVEWYKNHNNGKSAIECCMSDIKHFHKQTKIHII